MIYDLVFDVAFTRKREDSIKPIVVENQYWWGSNDIIPCFIWIQSLSHTLRCQSLHQNIFARDCKFITSSAIGGWILAFHPLWILAFHPVWVCDCTWCFHIILCCQMTITCNRNVFFLRLHKIHVILPCTEFLFNGSLDGKRSSCSARFVTSASDINERRNQLLQYFKLQKYSAWIKLRYISFGLIFKFWICIRFIQCTFIQQKKL